MDGNGIISTITISMLLSFSIYHFMYYFGRRRIKSEKFNLYFSLCTFSIIFFILFAYAENPFILKLIPALPRNIVPPIIYLVTILICYFFTKLFIILLNPPKNFLIFAKILFSILLAIESISFLSIVKGYEWFSKYLAIYLTITDGIVFFVYIIFFCYYVIIYKKYKNEVILIFSTAFMFLGLYLIISSIYIRISNDPEAVNNYGFIIIYILLVSYSITLKSNNEFKELMELKNSLEKTVKDRIKKLMMANEEIKKTYREKEEYFIQVSHEIKTPLTLIDNYLDKEIEERGISQSLKIMKYNLARLKKDVINVLDLEKIEKNGSAKPEIVDFSSVLRNYMMIFSELTKRKNIQLDYSIQNDLTVRINGYDLDKIINNLVENAIKFTEKNGRIIIELVKENGRILFSIEDNGIGMSEEEIENIFKPYYQTHHGNGIGFGLYIVKKMLDGLKAEISVESDIGKGSKFVIKFEYYNDVENLKIIGKTNCCNMFPEIYNYEKDINDTKYDENKKTVLIIEDNKELLYFLFNSFAEKYNTFHSENGISALAMINLMPKPDLIISDIMMEKMDGFEFFDNIKFDARHNDIPFIFLSARSNDRFRIQGLTKGAIDFINKPFDLKELMLKAESIINNRNAVKSNNMSFLKKKVIDALNLKNEGEFLTKTFLSEKISQREQEVIGLILTGKEIKEIGSILKISDSGVKKRLGVIYKKYGVTNKVELINYINSKKHI